MKLPRIAIVGLSASALGCTNQVYEEDTVKATQSSLRSAEPATERRVIRALVPGCDAVTTTTGTWNGEPLRAAIGTNNAFCAYEWSPARKDAPPDEEALNARAMQDRHEAYVVHDLRAHNGLVRPIAPPVVDDFTWLGPNGGTNPPSGSRTFTSRSSAPARLFAPLGSNPASPSSTLAVGASTSMDQSPFDLTAVVPRQPEGESGCEICSASWNNYLWFVLPPEALQAEAITLDVDNQSYVLGPITEPIFYMPIPAAWSNASFWVSGW